MEKGDIQISRGIVSINHEKKEANLRILNLLRTRRQGNNDTLLMGTQQRMGLSMIHTHTHTAHALRGYTPSSITEP